MKEKRKFFSDFAKVEKFGHETDIDYTDSPEADEEYWKNAVLVIPKGAWIDSKRRATHTMRIPVSTLLQSDAETDGQTAANTGQVRDGQDAKKEHTVAEELRNRV